MPQPSRRRLLASVVLASVVLAALAAVGPAMAETPSSTPVLPALWTASPALPPPESAPPQRLLPLDDPALEARDSGQSSGLAESIGAMPPARGTASARPRALAPLYVSFVALQGADAATTFRALDRGAVEANPMLAGLANNRGALVAVKASASVGTIYLAERLWRKNRVGAVVLMAALNGAYAVIVAHNYRATR